MRSRGELLQLLKGIEDLGVVGFHKSQASFLHHFDLSRILFNRAEFLLSDLHDGEVDLADIRGEGFISNRCRRPSLREERGSRGRAAGGRGHLFGGHFLKPTIVRINHRGVDVGLEEVSALFETLSLTATKILDADDHPRLNLFHQVGQNHDLVDGVDLILRRLGMSHTVSAPEGAVGEVVSSDFFLRLRISPNMAAEICPRELDARRVALELVDLAVVLSNDLVLRIEYAVFHKNGLA